MSNFSQQPPPFGLQSFADSQVASGYPQSHGTWPSDPASQQNFDGGVYPPSQLGGFSSTFNRSLADMSMNIMDQPLCRDYQSTMPHNMPSIPARSLSQTMGSGVYQYSRPQTNFYPYNMPSENRPVNWMSRHPLQVVPPSQVNFPTFPVLQMEPSNQNFRSPVPLDVTQNSNVYIKGLPPDMTDEKLYNICSSFGRVVSSKCIMNNSTNICKGFGFALYEDQAQAMSAIEGLNKYPYQASFAKSVRSLGSQKMVFEQQDRSMGHRYPGQHSDGYQNISQRPEGTTNVYVCNLPLHMNETSLEQLFSEFNVVSARVLRNSSGISRGVGFARFFTRSQAQAAIDKFNGHIPYPSGYDSSASGPPAPLCLRFAREKPHN